MGELPRVRPKSRNAWRDWLERNHASSTGVWLVYAKKHSGIPSLTCNDAVEEALCFGWIDSKINPIDDAFYMQVFTPRKLKSAGFACGGARQPAAHACAARYACTKLTDMAPSPTAEAQRLTDPLRTSPAAKMPGRLVSRKYGGRPAARQMSPRRASAGIEVPVSTKPFLSSCTHPLSQRVCASAPMKRKRARVVMGVSAPASSRTRILVRRPSPSSAATSAP